MTYKLLLNEVTSLLREILTKFNYPKVEFSVDVPPRADYGDLYSNIAFQLSKHLKRKPPEIAMEIHNQGISPYLSSKKNSLISSAEAHSAGYLNFRADYPKLTYETLSRTEVFNRGAIDIGKNKRVLIEHTSVNPNKAIHIGHVRNIVIGDSVYRILQHTNHNSYVMNYIDDSGAQVADIVVGFKFAGFPLDTNKKFDHYCGDEVYVRVNDLYEEKPELLEMRKYVLKEIERSNSETANFAKDLTLRVLKEQLKTCWRLKVRYDCLNFESQIMESKVWDKVLQAMKGKEIVKIDDEPGSKYLGCLVIKAGVEGEEKVLLRSDGTSTYLAKDIPYAAWKVGLVQDPFSYHRFTTQYDNTTLFTTKLDSQGGPNPGFHNADLSIAVIDTRQTRLQKIISKVLAMLGAPPNNYVHLGYEVVTLSSDTARALGIEIGNREFAHMSGRKGIYVNADNVLDILHRKAYDAAKDRNERSDEKWLHSVAEEVAVAAMRYSIIRQDLDKIVTFDINESLNLEGDTGPYLQYSHARACRILEKANQQDLTFTREMAKLLQTDYEIALIKQVSKFEIVLEDSASNLSPKSIARYAYGLATAFNAFYEKMPVLQEKNLAISKARLCLVSTFVTTMKTTLFLLGIEPLGKM